MRSFKNSIRQEVAKHFAEFFWEAESNFERVNLDSSTSVLRQLLLSFVHTAAQNTDSPQHRASGWRFIDWNEVEQRELLAEAKRLLETGELFLRGTAEEPHAPDPEAEATDSEPEAHVMEPLADDHSSDGEVTPTGVWEPAASAVAAAPDRAARSLLERLQAITTIMTALCICVPRKMSSASPARACMSASVVLLSFVVASLPIHSTFCNCCVHSSRFSPVPSSALRIRSNDQCDGNECCPRFGGCLRWHHPGVEPAAQCASTRENSPGSDMQ